jgi:hypothetical protein
MPRGLLGLAPAPGGESVPDIDLKYRAFLSYSHADTGVAQRVHRRLEGFHIDKELVGRVTPAGSIPKTLRQRCDLGAAFVARAEKLSLCVASERPAIYSPSNTR